MTIREFLDDLQETGNEELMKKMQDTVNVWDNRACRGYVITAMKKAGHTREQIWKVLEELAVAFEEVSVDDAAKIRNE